MLKAGKSDLSKPAERPNMNKEEAAAAIQQYKGQTFESIDALLTAVNSDSDKLLTRQAAREVLRDLKVTATSGFTIPKK
jgi:hypothetical protein